MFGDSNDKENNLLLLKQPLLMGSQMPVLPLSRQRLPSVPRPEKGNNERSKFDIREIDCETSEGKIHLETYLSVVMAPTFLFMKCIGINHVTSIKLLKAALILYNLFVIAIQCLAAVKRLTQLRFQKIDEHSASLIINLIYILSGALASIYLFHLGPRLHVIHERVMVELAQFDIKLEDARKVRRFSFGLVFFMVAAAASIAACNAVLNFRIGSSVYLEPLFHRHLIFIDIYVVFIGECACLMVAAVFIICCYILRRSMKKFRTHLQTEGIENQEIEPKEAIHKVSIFHERFQELHNAFHEVNEQYSYVHFYVFIVSVPLLCFILYVTMQVHCASIDGYPVVEYMIFVFWIIHLILMVVVFMRPAIILLENSKKLVAVSAQIFNQLMFKSTDSTLINYVQFFVMKVRSEGFAFTAGGFFNISKSIVLTLMSATFSYFLLLRQFTKPKDCAALSGS